MKSILKHLASFTAVTLFLLMAWATSMAPTAMNITIEITDENQFSVANADEFDYANVALTLNDDYTTSGLEVKAGDTLMIDISEFSDADGGRFGVDKKPLTLTLTCDLPNDEFGEYTRTWQ